jgi:signal transduction histidine kinase
LETTAILSENFHTVCQNLYTNAIKYNKDNGEIAISAKLSKNKIVLKFRDTGHGIHKKNLLHIFDEFWREKKPETKNIDGNGLGLSIVKRLVERSGGVLAVSSKEGVGTTFTVTLPMETSTHFVAS